MLCEMACDLLVSSERSDKSRMKEARKIEERKETREAEDDRKPLACLHRRV